MNCCRVNISIYFALFIACIIVIDQTGVAALALLCAALHETGHFLALYLFRIPVKEVSFKIFGVTIRLTNNTKLSYLKEAVIAISGCLMNLILCLISYVFIITGHFVQQAEIFFSVNLAVCILNILPVAPLDGGRALEAMLCTRLQYNTALNIVTVISAIFLIPLVILGGVLVVKTNYNVSLIIVSVYLIISLFKKGKLIVIN